MSTQIPPKVLCKVKLKETQLVERMSTFSCPLCGGHDRQADYYENHEVVKEKKA